MIQISIDDLPLEVPEGTLLVHAARQAGIEIPVFCSHDKLDPAGLCRMCLVEVEQLPKLTTACSTVVSPGMVVHTQSAKVRDARRGVLEFILTNHPLDCPVCDKGGECDLQNLTLAYGPGRSRFQEPKQHKPKRVGVGPFLVLDEERCILCQRCTRYDEQIVGESALEIVGRGQPSLVGTFPGQAYEHYFTGNTIELCPVGALTSKPYRFQARPWDLEHTEAVCTGCPVGCNLRVDTRAGRVVRLWSRENPEVENGWLCDRGRFGYGHLQAAERLRQPLLRKDGRLQPVSWDVALDAVAAGFRRALAQGGPAAVGGIGAARSTAEEAFLFQSFLREGLGTGNLDWRSGVAAVASARALGLPEAAEGAGDLSWLAAVDGLVAIGVSPVEAVPSLALWLRKARRQRAVRYVTVGTVPGSPTLGHVDLHVDTLAEGLADIVATLSGQKRIALVWNGAATDAEAVSALWQAFAAAGAKAHLYVATTQANARAAEALGMTPYWGPGYTDTLPGLDTYGMLTAAGEGRLEALWLLGANPAAHWEDGSLAESALARAFVVVSDLFPTASTALADVVLPAAASLEKTGHFVNLAGRLQFSKAAAPAPEGVPTDAEVLTMVAERLGLKWQAAPPAPEALAAWIKATPRTSWPKASGFAPPSPASSPRSAGLRCLGVERLFVGDGSTRFEPFFQETRSASLALAIHPEDLRELGLEEGGVALAEGVAAALRVRSDPGVARGHVWVPRGWREASPLLTAGSAVLRPAKEVHGS